MPVLGDRELGRRKSVPRTSDLPVNISYIQKEDVLPCEVTASSQAWSHPWLCWLAELQNEIRVWSTFVVAPETPGLPCDIWYLKFHWKKSGRKVFGKADRNKLIFKCSFFLYWPRNEQPGTKRGNYWLSKNIITIENNLDFHHRARIEMNMQRVTAVYIVPRDLLHVLLLDHLSDGDFWWEKREPWSSVRYSTLYRGVFPLHLFTSKSGFYIINIPPGGEETAELGIIWTLETLRYWRRHRWCWEVDLHD